MRAVDAAPGHQAYNVIIDVADPTVANGTIAHPGIAMVDAFLTASRKADRHGREYDFPGLALHAARRAGVLRRLLDARAAEGAAGRALVRLLFRAHDELS